MVESEMYNQLLNHILAERPELAQYAELFQQFTSQGGKKEQTDELELRAKKLSSIARRLRDELDDALDELDKLAKALGACEDCWGVVPRCSCCHGRGKPGYFQPERELFDSLILPALKQVTWLEVQEK